MRRSVLLAAGASLLWAQPNQTTSQPLQALPPWFKLGAELRGRGEWWRGMGHVPGADDDYYLHRLRLQASIEPAPRLALFIEVQDAQAPGANRRHLAGAVNTLDLRQAYVAVGNRDKGPVRLLVGRQELALGAERLVGAANWGNVARTFDALRLTLQGREFRLDAFAAALTPAVIGRFDRPRLQSGFYGLYASTDRLLHGRTLEPYILWKTAPSVRTECGSRADLDLWTAGVRSTGKLASNRLDYEVETALQWGRAGSDVVRAWAGHWMAGVPMPTSSPLRLLLEYNFASGDKDPHDSRRGTFDQLYPSNHAFYGTADQIGWRNIHDLAAGFEWRPTRRWRGRLDYHSFWLANARDAFYNEAGVEFVRNPQATNRRIGWELDLQADWQYSDRLRFGLGWARLFPGPYLRQSTPGSSFTYPYLMWQYRF